MKKAITKIPPQNIESEQAILASILIDPKSIDKIIHLLSPDDFYHPSNSIIFKSLIKMHEESKPLDILTVAAKLKDENLIEQIGGIEYLSSLVDILPNASNIYYYSTIVKDKGLLRKLAEVSSTICEKSYNFSGDVADLVDETEKAIFKLSDYRLKTDIQHIGTLLNEEFNLLESVYNKKGDLTGIPSGFVDLDKLTSGFQKSDFIIIAGRPAMGKTAFALNIALNASSKYDNSVLVFSCEMSSRSLAQRLLSSEARINSMKLRNGNLSMEEWQNLAAVGSELNELKLYIDDTPSITAMEVRAKARRLRREKGLDLVIIDYLQLMGTSKAETREQQISEISRSLKALSKELDIPVIALSQLNRGVEGRTDKRPYPSDLRESGAIEQDADLILFLYRDEVYNKDTKNPGEAEIIVSKHRNGPTGTIYLAFHKSFTRFDSAERS